MTTAFSLGGGLTSAEAGVAARKIAALGSDCVVTRDDAAAGCEALTAAFATGNVAGVLVRANVAAGGRTGRLIGGAAAAVRTANPPLFAAGE
jgi:hypothetical protein